MKIVICASSYPPDIRGGGEISTALIAQGLTQLGVDLTVATFTDGSRVRESVDGVDVLRLPCPNIYWSYRSSDQGPIAKTLWHLAQAFRPQPPKSVRHELLALEPDLIHTSTIEDFGPSVWRWAAAKGICTVHSLRSYCLLHRGATLYDQRRDRELGPDFLMLGKRVYAKSLRGVIGISHCVLNRHLDESFFRRVPSRVIGNPIDAPIAGSRDVQSGPLQLGVLGRISPEKGIDALIDCLQCVEVDVPWELKIAGRGDEAYVSSLQRRSDPHSVHFVGWQVSREFLETLDLLIVPSRWQEPFGRIVVEAFSAGVPVLCLRRGGLPELVDHGITGWVLDEWNPGQLAEIFSRCRQLDGERILKQAAEFTVEVIARKHLDFYQEVLGQQTSAAS